MRPQPTEIYSGAMPGCLRNQVTPLYKRVLRDIEPGEQLKYREGCEKRVGSVDSCPGSRVQKIFPHSAIQSSSGEREEGPGRGAGRGLVVEPNLSSVENTELLKT